MLPAVGQIGACVLRSNNKTLSDKRSNGLSLFSPVGIVAQILVFSGRCMKKVCLPLRPENENKAGIESNYLTK